MNEYVQRKVDPPGIALALFGAASILVNLLAGVFQLVYAIQALSSGASITSFLMSQGWSLPVAAAGFFASFVVLVAGLRLRSLRSPGLVYTGAVFAMLPCCVGPYCCCLGIPLGIWTILTMQDEQVKAAFAET